MWYRYFLAPPAGAARKSAVSVTLLVSPLSGASVDAYALSYLAGHTIARTADETRPAAHGKSWLFDARDGSTRHFLLLLLEDAPRPAATAPAGPARRVYGVYTQGETASFEQQRPILEAMARSLTLERPEHYREVRDERFAWSLRVPPTWRETRHFSGSGTMLMQFTSPALAADRSGATVHASLSVSVETPPEGETLDSFYQSARRRLGDAHQVVSHARWGRGYVDSMRADTSLAVSRQRRFYLIARGRAYTLAFEARDDVFYRVARWCDLIAATFRAGGEAALAGVTAASPAPAAEAKP